MAVCTLRTSTLSLLGLVGGAALLCMTAGCDSPSLFQVKYSGTQWKPQTIPAAIKVFRATPPDRAFEELGTVQVSCPTQTSGGGWSPSPWGAMGSAKVEGGCTYEHAIALARIRAAEAGADGIFHIETAAAPNGNLVSMLATAFRYKEAAAAP